MTRWMVALTVFLCLILNAKIYAADPVVDSVSYVVSGNEHVTTVEVNFSFSDADGDLCHVALFGHDSVTREHFPMVTFLEGDVYTQTFAPGMHSVRWVTSADREETGFSADNFVVYVQVSDSGRIAPGQYMIIDISGGPTASSYPVEFKLYVDVSKDLYKTDRIVLRELPDGSYAGVFEITQGQYELITGATPSFFAGNPMRPVEQVSWNDITDSGNYNAGFIKLLRDKTGLTLLNLPSETSWEFACRAGITNDFDDYTLNRGKGGVWNEALADPALDNLAWYQSNNGSTTHDAGAKQANAWGLFDTHGNVWEWTVTPTGTNRVIRGGSWVSNAGSCRAGDKTGSMLNDQDDFIGFRLALPTGR